MRRAILPLIAAALLAPLEANAQSAATTRVETRPFYGATVTLEEGVRVFRPLPSHDRVIINPGGVTPLNLNYEQKRSETHNYNYNQGSENNASAANSGNETAYVAPFSFDAGSGSGPRKNRDGGHGAFQAKKHGRH